VESLIFVLGVALCSAGQ